MRNRRKQARIYTYNLSDSIVHGDISQKITVHLTDPNEPDRRIYLDLNPEQAQYLSHRLRHHLEAIERDTADRLYKEITG